MKEATISADVVKSTSLNKERMILLQRYLGEYVADFPHRFPGSWGRVVRGDGLEFVISDSRNALLAAVDLKCYIKTLIFDPQSDWHRKTRCCGNNLDIRVSVGVGGLRTNDQTAGIIDGEAIYQSGRNLERMSRTTFAIASPDTQYTGMLNAIFSLIGFILENATPKQCEAIRMKISGMEESEIAASLSISTQAAYTLLQKSGWRAMSPALKSFSELDISGGIEK